MTIRYGVVPKAGVLVLLAGLFAAACQDEPTAPGAPQPQPTGPAGLVEITITGIGTPSASATARGLPAASVAASRMPAAGGGPLTSPRGVMAPTLTLLPSDGTVQLQGVSVASFTYGTRGSGGYRYVSATYRVRNATSGGTAYNDDRRNLTFLAVSQTTGTIGGTPFSALAKFNSSAVDDAVASQILPTSWADLSSKATLTTKAPDVLQVFHESELASLGLPSGVASIFPYGFVVRNPSSGTSRTLPANPGIGVYDGLVTFAFKVPLQATAADDPFTITAVFLPVDDNEAWVTQALEDTDLTSIAAIAARAGSLTGAQIRSLIRDSVGTTPTERMCVVRTAGTASSPTGFLIDTVLPPTRSPAPYVGAASFLASPATFSANFCRPMSAATPSTFVVNGSQSGRRFLGGGYTGVGTPTLSAPSGAFFAGEEIEEVLTTGLRAFTGSKTLPVSIVTRYRVATAISAGPKNGNFGAGNTPSAVAVGDVNGDGNSDLVVADNNFFSGGVTILLGDGAGNFTPGNSYGVVSSPTPRTFDAIALGDVDNDGHQDIVVANDLAGQVSVLLGDGSGGFGAASSYAVGSNPSALALGFVNGDANLDIVTADRGSGTVSVLLGSGGGAFGAATSLAAGTGPTSVALGLVNSGTNLDIVVADGVFDSVTVLFGDGSGGFPSATAIGLGTGANPGSVALGLLNADGNLDMVTANRGNGTVSVLLGDGLGGFSAAIGSPYAAGSGPVSVALGDLNGNGTLDAVLANLNSNNVTVLLGSGTGAFTSAGAYLVPGTAPRFVSLGDFNKDGHPDFVTANTGLGNNVTAMMGDGAGFFAVANPFTTQSGPVSIAAGDIDGDGDLDVVTADRNASAVSVLKGDATGKLAAFSTAFAGTPSAVALGDLDGDGDLDIAVTDTAGDAVRVLINNGSGSFVNGSGSPFSVGAGPRSVAIGDVNGDGHLDLVTANAGADNLSVLLGNGSGGFTAAVSFPVGSQPNSVVLGDFNHDGRLDIAVANRGDDNVTILLGDGAGGFASAGTVPVGTAPTSVVAGDFNGDGRPDLATANGGSTSYTILTGDGTGGFTAGTTGLVNAPVSLAVGDVNGDGHLDLVVTSRVSNAVTVLTGNGAGSFSEGNPISVGNAPAWSVLLDINADRKLEIVSANAGSNTAAVLVAR